MWILAEDFSLVFATIALAEEFEETKITLSVKDSDSEKLQDFEIDMKVINDSAVISDYMIQEKGINYNIGSFVGDSAVYYIDTDAYPYNIYTYNAGEIGSVVIGTINPVSDKYVLASKTEGCLENIAVDTEFIFQGEDALYLLYILAPNSALEEYIAGLDDEHLGVAVNVSGNVKTKAVIYTPAKPEYSEIEGDVSSFDNMGFESLGLKITYNEGETNEFSIVIQVVFASMEDIMNSMQ